MTVFDAIIVSLEKAAAYNPNDQVAPAVVLWTDHDRQWEPLSARIGDRLPQLLTLGPHDPQAKTGPAIWLRAMIARKLPEVGLARRGRAHPVPAGHQPAATSGRGRVRQGTSALGRIAVPRRLLDTGQRQGLDDFAPS